jgi:hypothetical protein
MSLGYTLPTEDGIHGNSIEAVLTLVEAVRDVQASVSGVVKNKRNDHFKSKYADLEGVIDTIKPYLVSKKLSFHQVPSFVQSPGSERGAAEVRTFVVCGSSGLAVWAFTTEVPVKQGCSAQDAGSAITYAKRYALQSFFGLPSEDDDGNAAVRNKQAAKPEAQAPSKEGVIQAWEKTIRESVNAERLSGLVKALESSKTFSQEDKTKILKMIEDRRKSFTASK